jgi:hypothetical protein
VRAAAGVKPALDYEGIRRFGNYMSDPGNTDSKPPLTPAAQRALAEARLRRAERERQAAEKEKESSSRDGLDPTRYGDWEVKGQASDF